MKSKVLPDLIFQPAFGIIGRYKFLIFNCWFLMNFIYYDRCKK